MTEAKRGEPQMDQQATGLSEGKVLPHAISIAGRTGIRHADGITWNPVSLVGPAEIQVGDAVPGQLPLELPKDGQ